MIALSDLDDLAVRLDPSLLMEDLGFEPDAWQRALLRSRSERLLINCHRQSGKSTCVATLAVATAHHESGSLTLIVSASQRQANELFRKVTSFHKALGGPIPAVEDSATSLTLSNGSRIVSLPDSPDTIVGFSGHRLIIIDEAARVSDESFGVLTPMRLVSRGRLVALSTPKGVRGWYHYAWTAPDGGWEKVTFRASNNPRIDRGWLEEEYRIHGPRWCSQEYECEFLGVEDSVFDPEAVDRAFTGGVQPRFAEL